MQYKYFIDTSGAILQKVVTLFYLNTIHPEDRGEIRCPKIGSKQETKKKNSLQGKRRIVVCAGI